MHIFSSVPPSHQKYPLVREAEVGFPTVSQIGSALSMVPLVPTGKFPMLTWGDVRFRALWRYLGESENGSVASEWPSTLW